MADYTLHLGFRWDGPTIGSILGTGPALPHDARFLQYALATADGAAAWFQFQPQDTVHVLIWDLSSTSAPNAAELAVGLSMSFGPIDVDDGGDGSYTTIDPDTLVAGDDISTQSQEYDGKSSTVLVFDDIVPSSDDGCPWGSARRCYAAGDVTLTAEASYEVGFIVTVAYQGNSQIFVSDPEVIVGSGGAGPTNPN
jgi:hypothetical protein